MPDVQFVSALELSTYLTGETDINALAPEWVWQANAVLQMISADIEIAAGVPIAAGTTTAVLPGVWGRDLLLPAGPIRDVTTVSVDGTTLAASGYWWNDRDLIRRGVSDLGPGYESDELDNPRQGAQHRPGSSWGGPASTIRVDYAYGFAAIPAFIRSLALRIVARDLPNLGGVTQESLGSYSVTYGSSGDSGSHVRPAEKLALRHALNRTAGTITPAAR